MKNSKEFLSKRETANKFNKRLSIFIKEYYSHKKKRRKKFRLLDIGCGRNTELFFRKKSEDIYYGCDFFYNTKKSLKNYISIDLNEESLSLKFKNKKFDVIFCGEVIEHLFSPDKLIDEIKELMDENSILILSTPNLGYYLNRLMLFFGVSPFFLENSSETKLGRKFKFLGQGNKTEGHIKVFTYGAIKDLLKQKGFEVVKIKSVPVWDNFFDRFVCLFSRSLSANNIFILQKKK